MDFGMMDSEVMIGKQKVIAFVLIMLHSFALKQYSSKGGEAGTLTRI
jgi:hypothetical protein